MELMRGNFVGKGDKEEHQKKSQGVWRGTRWIKFSSSWERDEKADSWQLRVLEPSSSAHQPLIRLGSQRRGAVRVWLYLLIGGERTLLASTGPTPCSKPCFAVVTEVLPPPMEGSRTAGHYQLLPEGAGSLHSQTWLPPPPGSGGVALRAARAGTHCPERPPCLCSDQLCGSANGPSVVSQLFTERLFWAGFPQASAH